ncbi:MAG TPA: alpha-ketoglutarate-dependent dioxygenase AlkB [Humisphaera sp.]
MPTPDVIVRKAFLPPADQRRVVETVFAISPGFYTPRTRFGSALSLRMNCLGRHWSARDYKYHAARTDADGLPCAPIPDDLQVMAARALLDTGYVAADAVRPFDVCIVNLYAEGTGKLGDHVDNSESPAALASGYPVVSLSVGAGCVFRIGGRAKTDPYETHTLDSGDLVIFGRAKRLAYHGVRKVLPGTTPPNLGLPEPGRINLTFRVL